MKKCKTIDQENERCAVAPVKRLTPRVCSYTIDRRIVVLVQVVEEDKHAILLHLVLTQCV